MKPNLVKSQKMAPIIEVKTFDSLIKKQRVEGAKRVLDQFGDLLSGCRLLCFLDDEDWQEFKRILGETNRGFHRSISNNTDLTDWPEYITRRIFVDNPSSFWYKRVFDHVIYLHGSTCANSIGLTMTLAHELQHVVQRITVPELLTAGSIFRNLPNEVIQNAGLQWSDILTEREARAVAKKIAVALHGREAVDQFLLQRASTTTDPVELADVQFIQGLDTSTPYILKDETLSLFAQLKNYRAEIKETIEWLKSDPEFEPVNLDSFLPPVTVNTRN